VQGATVTVDGPNSGRIQTTKPVPYLPALLADSAASILTAASYGSDGAITQPVGTGPFKFVSWSPGDRVVLQSHDAYWRGAPKIQSVQYRFVPQAQTRGNLLRTGEADITNVIAATDVPALKTAPGVTVMTNPDPRFRAAYINTQNGPTSDVRVRQALAHATDRDVIVNTLLQNQGTVQAAIFRSEYPWSNPAIKGLPLDPERAKSLLADAGFGTSNPLSITILTYNARPELPLIAQVLQQQWATVGVNCQISIQESAAIETIAFKQGTHNIALYSRSPLLVYDPQVIYETDFTSTGSYNLSRYSAQDAKIKAAGSMTDTNARYDQYRQIEQQIIEGDVALVVISGYVDIDGVHSGVTGYQQHPTQLLALTEMIDKA
jgi:peptide/nickel transport system substrate-binding protein